MENPWKEKSSRNPQREKGHRQIANSVWNALTHADLTAGEYKVIMTVIDRTWGHQKLFSPISLHHFELHTNLSRRGLCGIIAELESRRYIVVERDGTKTSNYLFNKHYDTWLSRQFSLDSAREQQFTSKSLNAIEVGFTRLGKSSSLPSEPQDTSSSEPSTPDDEAVKKVKKDNKERTKETLSVFDTWNSLGVIQHKKLTDKMKRKIHGALENYTLDEICAAMRTYAEILKSEDYWWSYKWTLEEFLQRGLEKFMDEKAARENFSGQDRAPRFSAAPARRSAGRVPGAEELEDQKRRYFGRGR